jgi:four helix bundle protein
MSYGYQDLEVWKKAYRLTIRICRISRKFPDEENYGLKTQLRRASVSIMGNLAQGYSKRYKKDVLRYITYAIKSNNELELYLMLSRDLKYISRKDYKILNFHNDKIGDMLLGLRDTMEHKSPEQ